MTEMTLLYEVDPILNNNFDFIATMNSITSLNRITIIADDTIFNNIIDKMKGIPYNFTGYTKTVFKVYSTSSTCFSFDMTQFTNLKIFTLENYEAFSSNCLNIANVKLPSSLTSLKFLFGKGESFVGADSDIFANLKGIYDTLGNLDSISLELWGKTL